MSSVFFSCRQISKCILSSRTLLFTFSRSLSSNSDNIRSDYSSDGLYDSHIPTNCIQRTALTIGSAIGGVINPERVDLVFTFGEVTGWYALKCMYDKMNNDITGQEILRDKPRLSTTTLNLQSLRQYPDETLGREYVRFIDYYGYTPDGRTNVKYVDDPELAYVMQRYRELHDFIHTLLRIPTSVYGEIVVKQFEAIQTGLPLCVLGGYVTPSLKLSLKEQIELLTVYGPWAINNGLQSTFFMNVYFEKFLEESIHNVRKELNIDPLPSPGSLDCNIWNYTNNI